MESNEVLLSLKHISLEKDNQELLSDVELDIFSHEIHGLVGNYVSGKEHIVSILRGLTKPTSGEIRVVGKRWTSIKTVSAFMAGILILCDNDSFHHNIRVKEFLSSDSKAGYLSIVNGRLMEKRFALLKEKYSLTCEGDDFLGTLSASVRFFLHIIKIFESAPILIVLMDVLDKLNSRQLKIVNVMLHEFREKGVPTLLITSNIDDIYKISDSVSILKNGKIIFTDNVNKIEKINLIKLAYAEISKFDNEAFADENFYKLLRYNEVVLSELPINLIIIDKNLQIKIANKNAVSFFGISPYDYLKTSIVDLFHYSQNLLKELLESFNSRDARVIDNLRLDINNKSIIANVKTYPIFDGPDFIGLIIVVEDITAQENYRKQLVLSENLASIGLLSAGVAHEINNPLEIITNCTSYLSYHIEDEMLVKKINSIESEVRSISKIISNLVGLTHSKSFKQEEFELLELMKVLTKLLQPKADEKKIRISIFHDVEIIPVLADITEIKQILLNLIKNSIESIENGGEINLLVSIKNEEEVEILIKDDGPGMDEDLIDNIFLPFYSTKNSREINQGLGLYITHGIVSKYNGEISARNLNPGCEFRVTLPILFLNPYNT